MAATADLSHLELRVSAQDGVAQLNRYTAAAKGADAASVQLDKVVKQMVAGLSLIKLAGLVREAALLAARYETLGVVMNTVGANAGKTSAQMARYQRQLEDTGISAIAARENLAKLASANIDLGRSAEIARIAQNAAVVAGITSADAFDRLTAAISTGNTKMLRTLGIYVDIDDGLKAYAKTIGSTKNDLTGFERIQANVNTVVAGSVPVIGVYAAAMETAGKQISSLARYTDNAKVAVGAAFQPQVIASVRTYASALKLIAENADLVAGSFRLIVGVGAARAFTAGIASIRTYTTALRDTRSANIASAQAEAVRADAALVSAQRTVASRQAEIQTGIALRASDAELAVAKTRLTAAHVAHKVAADASTAAEVRLSAQTTISGRAAATATGAWNSLSAALGGKLGVALTALTVGYTIYAAKQDAATRKREEFRESLQKDIVDKSIPELQRQYDDLILKIAEAEKARIRFAQTKGTEQRLQFEESKGSGLFATIRSAITGESASSMREINTLRDQLSVTEKELVERRNAAAAAAKAQSAAESDAYKKAYADAVDALDRQKALNAVLKLGDTDRERRMAAINAEYDLKAELRKIDEEFNGSRASSLKKLAVALFEAKAAERANTEAKEDQAKLDAILQSRADYRKQQLEDERQALKRVQDALASLQGARAAEKDIEGLQRQINLFGKTAEEAKKLRDEYLLMDKAAEYRAAGLDEVGAALAAQDYVTKANELEKLVATTTDWADTLKEINGVLRNLGDSLKGGAADSVKFIASITNALELLIRAQKAAEDAAAKRKGQGYSGAEKTVGFAGAALAGFAGGSAFGSTTTSKAAGYFGGALSGAASGALAGAALGPVGAVVGGAIGAITGAVGGLLSASKNATLQLREQEAAQEKLRLTIAAMNAEMSGDALSQSIAQVRAQFEQLRLDTEKAYSGKRNEAERKSVLADLAKAEDDRVEKLRREYEDKQTGIQQDQEARQLRAAGRIEEAKVIEELRAQESALAALRRDGASAATIAKEEETLRMEADRRKKERLEEERRSIADYTNANRAFTDVRGGAQASFDEAQQRRYDDAVAKGASAAELAAIAMFNLAEAADRAAQIVEQDTRAREGFVSRILGSLATDTAGTRTAEDAARFASDRQEIADAIREGMAPGNLALLQFAQLVERERVAMVRAIEDGTKAIQEAAAKQIAAIDAQIDAEQKRSAAEQKRLDDEIAAVRDRAAADQAAIDAQIDLVRSSTEAQLTALGEQRNALVAILDANKQQLQVEEAALAVAQRAFEALDGFAKGLSLSNASPLSPVAMRAEAERQFEDLRKRAFAGDANAAASLPAAAQAFLDASRGVNASGRGYQDDFARVSGVVSALRDQFGGQMSAAASSVESLRSLVASTEQQIATLDTVRETLQETAAKQIELLQASRDAIGEAARLEIEQLEAMKVADREASTALLDLLAEQRKAVESEAQKQIEQLIKVETEAFKARVEASEYYAEWQRITEEQGLAARNFYASALTYLAQPAVIIVPTEDGGSSITVPTVTAPVSTGNAADLALVSAELRRIAEGQTSELEVMRQQLRTVADGHSQTVAELKALGVKLDAQTRATRRGIEAGTVS